jgi:hypothetical protein
VKKIFYAPFAFIKKFFPVLAESGLNAIMPESIVRKTGVLRIYHAKGGNRHLKKYVALAVDCFFYAVISPRKYFLLSLSVVWVCDADVKLSRIFLTCQI